MTTKPMHFNDEDFDLRDSENCHLLLRLSSHAYTYVVTDPLENRIRAMGKNTKSSNSENTPRSQFENFCSENEHLKLSYKKVKVSFETQSFTFIPEELFDKDCLQDYSKFIGAAPDSILFDTLIKSTRIHNIFAIDRDLKGALHRTFPEALFVCQANPMISSCLRKKEKGNHSELFFNFNCSSFEAVIIQDNTFRFYNLFSASSADEFNYFLLNLITQFEIDRTVPVSIAGDIDAESEFLPRINKYFDEVKFAEGSEEIMKTNAFGAFSYHNFEPVLVLDLCV